MYIDEIIKHAEKVGLAVLPEQHSCSPNEIKELEEDIGLEFPLAYKEFLLWAGKAPIDVLDNGVWDYSQLPHLQTEAPDLLLEYRFPETLPKDVLVVYINGQGWEFYFLRTDEGDNPPVYLFTVRHQRFVKRFCTFTEFLEFNLETYHIHQIYHSFTETTDALKRLREKFAPCE